METTIRKIGNSEGAIIPGELNSKTGNKYQIVKINDTFVMTSVQDNSFTNWTA
ncbi:AbrB/MazE/SpoVT family DNA-binding domain-containing protein [Levilactobacillus namurensis]|uniref:Surface layer protein A domain-containing protein n=1 Tax=Levilactobacillus namurensis TaxID=380393 RepID=A0AAW8W290_9LACO|nr:hypothetical protein [Levilactobacillus namurensis]MDT7013317.1 hypothetical protein [Levilactobacillus namurensis]